jgi:sec-independent protein translocase protein TatA
MAGSGEAARFGGLAALPEVVWNDNEFLGQDWEAFVIEGLFQPTHLILIFGIALLVFGPKKLPELGKGLGDGIRGFKAAMNPAANSEDVKKDGPEV